MYKVEAIREHNKSAFETQINLFLNKGYTLFDTGFSEGAWYATLILEDETENIRDAIKQILTWGSESVHELSEKEGIGSELYKPVDSNLCAYMEDCPYTIKIKSQIYCIPCKEMDTYSKEGK